MSGPLDFLQNLIQTGEGDVSSAAKTVLNAINQPKQRIKEQPQTAPVRTKQNGAVSDAASGYLQSSTGPTDQMGIVNPNASPGKQFGQAMAAPIDPASDATNMVAGGIHSALPFLVGGVKVADQGASFLDKVLGRGKQAATNAAPTAADLAGNTMRIVLDPSYFGAGREKAVQQTVDSIVPGATALEKYTNLQPTMDQLGSQISRIMQMSPKSTNLDQLVSDFDKNLEANGIYRTADNAKSTVQKTADGYIKDLFNAAGGNGATPNPSEITDQALHNMKQAVNQDAQSIYKKIGNNTSLTDKDRVILQARQTLDDAMTTLHPEIKQLTTMQSHLFDAAGSLFKGREQEIKQAGQNLAANAGKGNAFTNFIGNVAKYPFSSFHGFGISSLIAGTGALTVASLMQPKQYNFSTGNTTNLPGLAQIRDRNGNPLNSQQAQNYLSQVQNINNQEAALQSQLQSYNPSDVKAANAKIGQLEAQKQTLQAQNATIAPYINAYTSAQQKLDQLKVIDGQLNNINPKYFTLLSGIGNELPFLKNYIPNYPSFKSSVDALNKMGVDTTSITNSLTPKQAQQAIQAQIQAVQLQLKNTLSSGGYSVGSGANSPQSNLDQTQQQNTTAPAPTNQPPAPQASPAPTAVPSANQGQTIDQSLYKFIPPSMLNQVQNGGQGGGYTSSDLLNSILQKAIV